MATEMKRWNLFLPPDLLSQIKDLAQQNNVAAADVVRIACEKYLAAVKKAQMSRLETQNGA